MYKVSEVLCRPHREDYYSEDNCPICTLKTALYQLQTALYKACERLNDGSAWADESEEFLEMCKIAEFNHPARI